VKNRERRIRPRHSKAKLSTKLIFRLLSNRSRPHSPRPSPHTHHHTCHLYRIAGKEDPVSTCRSENHSIARNAKLGHRLHKAQYQRDKMRNKGLAIWVHFTVPELWGARRRFTRQRRNAGYVKRWFKAIARTILNQRSLPKP
jgi:hypothetical protein